MMQKRTILFIGSLIIGTNCFTSQIHGADEVPTIRRFRQRTLLEIQGKIDSSTTTTSTTTDHPNHHRQPEYELLSSLWEVDPSISHPQRRELTPQKKTAEDEASLQVLDVLDRSNDQLALLFEERNLEMDLSLSMSMSMSFGYF